MGDNLTAVQNALAFLGASNPTKKVSNAVPTAKTRAALDLLAGSTPEQLTIDRIDLRQLTEDLFNWGETPKASKTLMRGLSTALNTPDKYSHAVELTAYIAALAPLLEPDRLTRLFTAINEVETAYAPSRYTMQLSRRLSQLFSRYPQERIEKLAYSLWVEAHKGRWWDLTAGAQPVAVDEQETKITGKELLDRYTSGNIAWTPNIAKLFKQIPENDLVRETLEQYNNDLLREKAVDPDIALLASYITWLTPDERPESPVGSLIDTLNTIVQELEYKLPEKPKKFSELFPDIKLYGGAQFPFPNSIMFTEGKELVPGVRLEVVNNATQLADNRTYMGNCTWSYKNRMEKGEYVLYRVHNNDEIYNGSLILNKDRWRLGELNSRFNRGQVPNNIRTAFERFIAALPPVKVDNELTANKEQFQKLKNLQARKYRYRIQ